MKKIILILLTSGLLLSLIPIKGLCLLVEQFLIDDFRSTDSNLVGGKSDVYEQAPSKIALSYKYMRRRGIKTQVLALKYDKAMSGGPYGTGGWCGYYTLLKTENRPYFDVSEYKYLTLWVKGKKGTENFMVGMSDIYLEKKMQNRKSKPIGEYLKEGRVTKYWQKARIPLDEFFLDLKKVVSITIDFERELYADGSGKGTVYIDDIALEK
jgi:hypothetical protein